jgi:hypothetical protein
MKNPVKKTAVLMTAFFFLGCRQTPEVKEISLPVPSTSEPVRDTTNISLQTSDPVIDDSMMICKDLGGSMEEGFETLCNYREMNLDKAYLLFVSSNHDETKYLELPVPKDGTVIKKENADVSYNRESSSKLLITLSFPGGVTTITFTEKGKDTEILINKSPD